MDIAVMEWAWAQSERNNTQNKRQVTDLKYLSVLETKPLICSQWIS